MYEQAISAQKLFALRATRTKTVLTPMLSLIFSINKPGQSVNVRELKVSRSFGLHVQSAGVRLRISAITETFYKVNCKH